MTTMKHLLKEFSPHTIGCSSAIVPGSWTKTGESYHSRNMDYPIIGTWEANPTVIFHEPEGTDEIPHIAIASAGFTRQGSPE